MILKVKAPVRIDFAGGWTDIELFAKSEGGAVLNATIDRYVEGRFVASKDEKNESGISVSYGSVLPAGCGLGTSSAMNVVLLSLIKHETFKNADNSFIAESAFQLEKALGIKGGKQDQYAAAYGGFNFMEFTDKVSVKKVNIRRSTIDTLERRLILCYSGKSRLSSDIHDKVWDRYINGKNTADFRALKGVAELMRGALESDNLNYFGELLAYNWEYQKALHPEITNEKTEELFKVALINGAISGKACGAGGGGCLLFYCEEDSVPKVEMALESIGGKILPFKFTEKGITWEESPYNQIRIPKGITFT
jgi:D-glycero-alpha-D-manno-heptose-7-phosphate kinase